MRIEKFPHSSNCRARTFNLKAVPFAAPRRPFLLQNFQSRITKKISYFLKLLY